MKLHLRVTLLYLVLCALVALAQDSHSKVRDPHPLSEVDERKFTVELTIHASPDPSRIALVTHQQQHFLEHLATLDIPQYTVLHQYKHAWNGITFQINVNSDKVLKEDLHKIAELPEVKAIHAEQKHYPLSVKPKSRKRQDTSSVHRDINTHTYDFSKHYNGYAADPLSAHNLTGVQAIHQTTKLAGNGIKVGVIDSGIDYRHPALGGCFGQGCRVTHGYDFVGNSSNSSDLLDKCSGHGTHCAGIIGGKDPDGPWVGVAYNVTFGAYRIFGCTEDTSLAPDSLIINAMEKAVADGMDIISLSLGGWGWPESAIAAAASSTAEHTHVIIAIGNEGDKGIWSADSPGVGYETIAVASINNLVVSEFYFTPNYDTTHLIAYHRYPDESTPAFDNIAMPLIDISSECPPTNNHNIDVKGKILLIDLSRCPKSKYKEYPDNFIGVLYYRAGRETLYPGKERSLKVGRPSFVIRNNDGEWLAAMLKTHPDLKLTSSQVEKAFAMPQPGKLSYFSSYGITPDFDLKPDISAPGADILSTYPLNMGHWAQLTGTSMATPYVAGAVALLLEKHGKIPPSTIRSLLLNTAVPVQSNDGTIYPTPQQGSGLINVYEALNRQTCLHPTKYALNNGSSLETIIGEQNFSIQNLASTSVKYSISHLPATSFSGYDGSNPRPLAVVISSNATADITFSKTVVIVPGNGMAVISWSIKPPKLNLTEHWFYSGFIKVTPNSSEKPRAIPYVGVLSSGLVNVLQQENGYPYLNFLNSTIKDPSEIVSVTIKNDNPSRHFLVGVQSADNKTEHGLIYNMPHMARSETRANISFFGCIGGNLDKETGCYKNSSRIASGSYRIFVRAVKLFGNINRQNDYENWVSPPFTIQWQRPLTLLQLQDRPGLHEATMYDTDDKECTTYTDDNECITYEE